MIVGTLLWVLLCSVFCWSQSPLGLSILAAGTGAFVGSLAAHRSRESSYHLGKVWGATLLTMFGVSWFIDLLRWVRLPSFVIGGSGLYLLSDALFWGIESFLAVFLLRWTSTKKPALVSLELLVAGGSVVELFAAHRHGFVNRPYAIVDPLWSQGIDPLPVFLAFGALVAILILILGASHSPKRGRWVDVVALCCLMAGLFLYAPTEKLKDLQNPPEVTTEGGSKEESRGSSSRGQGRLPAAPSTRGGDSSNQDGTDAQKGGKTGEGSTGQGGQQAGQAQPTDGGQSTTSGGQEQTTSGGQKPSGTGGQASDSQSQGNSGGQGQNPQGQSGTDAQGQQAQGQGSTGGQGQQPQDQGSTGGQGQQAQDQGSTGGQGQQPQDQGSTGGQGQQPQDQSSTGGQGQQPQDQSSTGGQSQPPPSGTGGGQGQQPPDQEQNDQPDQELSQDSGQGGNSDELNFRDSKNESEQNPPIAVVIFRDDYTPDSGMYYFRQNAFSQYNGTKLVADTSGLYDQDVARNFPGAVPVEPKVPELDKELFRELETKVALLTDHAKPFGLVNATKWTATGNPDPKRFQKAFEVTSMVLDKPLAEVIGRRAGNPSWDQDTWKHYTTGPDDARYEKLLEEIVAGFPDAPKNDPLIKALMVKLWLEENGVYSLSSTHEGAEDPTADFLFGDRTGYCVFFAHAAVYLYRTAGMPSRTASGYAVEASQRGNGSALLVPGKSAHSWPEVYIDGMGWVVLDISPAKSLDEPPPPNDPGLQQMLGEMARQDPEETPPDPVEQKVDIQQMLRDLIRAVASAVPYALLLLLLAAYAYKIYRRYEPNVCPEQDLPAATLRSLLDLLNDAGFTRDEGEPRESFARRMKELSPSFYLLTQAHLRQNLGSPKDRPNYPWKKTYLDACAEIKNGTPMSQFIKGWINPISWMKVH